MRTGAFRIVREEPATGPLPIWHHPEWVVRFPWLVQGVTSAGTDEEPFDLGLFGSQPVGAVMRRWRRLGEALAMPATAHAHQVHGSDVYVHETRAGAGLLVLHGYDGHATRVPGLLLTASVADCVPVYLVDTDRRAVAVVHAGWRGVAAGILGRALGSMIELYGSAPADVWVHCGPAICGECYEVGPEVHEAVHPGGAQPTGPTPIDLRAALGAQAVARGVQEARVSISAHCTRCGPGGFFSHRGGSAGRQMGLLGVRMAR